MFYLLLFVLIILVAMHDFRSGRIPNWVTLPLLGIGLISNFPSASLRAGPGALESGAFVVTWLACLLLFLAWRAGWVGGGDAKLWMALLWLAPAALAQTAALVMSGTFILTALAQFLWRKITKRTLSGVKSYGAWRSIPYAIWLCTIPISGWLF